MNENQLANVLRKRQNMLPSITAYMNNAELVLSRCKAQAAKTEATVKDY